MRVLLVISVWVTALLMPASSIHMEEIPLTYLILDFSEDLPGFQLGRPHPSVPEEERFRETPVPWSEIPLQYHPSTRFGIDRNSTSNILLMVRMLKKFHGKPLPLLSPLFEGKRLPVEIVCKDKNMALQALCVWSIMHEYKERINHKAYVSHKNVNVIPIDVMSYDIKVTDTSANATQNDGNVTQVPVNVNRKYANLTWSDVGHFYSWDVITVMTFLPCMCMTLDLGPRPHPDINQLLPYCMNPCAGNPCNPPWWQRKKSPAPLLKWKPKRCVPLGHSHGHYRCEVVRCGESGRWDEHREECVSNLHPKPAPRRTEYSYPTSPLTERLVNDEAMRGNGAGDLYSREMVAIYWWRLYATVLMLMLMYVLFWLKDFFKVLLFER